MGGGYKHRPEGMDAVLARLDDLQKQLDALRNAAPIRNSQISDGGTLTVSDDLGNIVARIGQTVLGERGVSFVNPDGVEVLTYTARNAITGLPLMALQDNGGVIVTGGDSAGTGQGIFWPPLMIPFAGMTIAQWPFTTSGSFTTIAQAASRQTSQRLHVVARAVVDGGATGGQAKLVANGVQIGSTVTFGVGVVDAVFDGLVTDYANMGGYEFLEIQARVSGGAGNARAQVYETRWENHG